MSDSPGIVNQTWRSIRSIYYCPHFFILIRVSWFSASASYLRTIYFFNSRILFDSASFIRRYLRNIYTCQPIQGDVNENHLVYIVGRPVTVFFSYLPLTASPAPDARAPDACAPRSPPARRATWPCRPPENGRTTTTPRRTPTPHTTTHPLSGLWSLIII